MEMAGGLGRDKGNDCREHSAGDHRRNEVDDAATDDQADIKEPVANDCMGDHSNHDDGEERAVLAKLRTARGERYEKVGYSGAETGAEEGKKEISELLTFRAAGQASFSHDEREAIGHAS